MWRPDRRSSHNDRVGDGLDVSRVAGRRRRPADSAGRSRGHRRSSRGALAVDIVRDTRSRQGIVVGAGLRGGIALVRVARGMALLDSATVTPDDIKRIAILAATRRSTGLEIEGLHADEVLRSILDGVEYAPPVTTAPTRRWIPVPSHCSAPSPDVGAPAPARSVVARAAWATLLATRSGRHGGDWWVSGGVLLLAMAADAIAVRRSHSFPSGAVPQALGQRVAGGGSARNPSRRTLAIEVPTHRRRPFTARGFPAPSRSKPTSGWSSPGDCVPLHVGCFRSPGWRFGSWARSVSSGSVDV